MQNTGTWSDRHFYPLMWACVALPLCGYAALGLLG